MDKPRRTWPWIVAILIGVPVLYVASLGPVLRARLRPGQDLIAAPGAYWPVGWTVRRSLVTQGCVRWYLRLWLPERTMVAMPTAPFAEPDWLLLP